MARQLVYEGPDLQHLLQQVIDEHGPARIHPPERRRKGGVLGFFAREVYVITVDVDAPVTTANGAGKEPTGLPAAPVDAAPVDATARTATAVTGAHPGQLFGYGSGSGGASLGPEAVQTPLSALVESTEDDADLGSAGRNGSVPAYGADHQGRDLTGTNPSVGDLSVAPSGVDRVPRHAVSPETDKPFGEVLSEVASSLGEEPGTFRPDPDRLRRPRRLTAGGDTAGPVEVPASLSDPGGAPGDDPGPETFEEMPEDEALLDDEGRPAAVQLPLIQIEEEPPDLGATIVDLLRAAGFPEHLLPRAPLLPEHSTIEAVFAALPEPPPLPSEAGGLVAVVGSAGLVRPVANAVALTVGCPRDEVAVASTTASDRHARPEYRARTAAQAAAMSPGWRRDRVGVVAVYAPPLGADQRWTRQMLRALRPSCVWGMAGATTKPDDVRRWIAAIGGVDALAVTEVAATATPAAILSLGIPVSRLDDEAATPARWASVVADLVTKH